MSVEKFKPQSDFESGILRKPVIPYVQIMIKILNECRYGEALAVWCHLQAKPENWIVNPVQLQNHFNWGKDKVYKILTYLIATNLLVRNISKDAQGRYLSTEYEVLDGSNFINIQQDDKNAHPLPENQETVAKTPLPCFPLPVNQHYTNNIKQQTILKRKERERLSPKIAKPKSKTKSQPSPQETNFVPDAANCELARRHGLSLMDELASFHARHKGSKTQYEFERWLKNGAEYQSKRPKISQGGAMMEWGPGHPSYDEQLRVKQLIEAQRGNYNQI